MKKRILPRKNLNNPQVKSYIRAVEKGFRAQHVVPADSGWAVKGGGARRATKIFDIQKKAVSYAEKIAKSNKTELFIHKSNGRIKSRKSYF